jgi:hypothetical protein
LRKHKNVHFPISLTPISHLILNFNNRKHLQYHVITLHHPEDAHRLYYARNRAKQKKRTKPQLPEHYRPKPATVDDFPMFAQRTSANISEHFEHFTLFLEHIVHS